MEIYAVITEDDMVVDQCDHVFDYFETYNEAMDDYDEKVESRKYSRVLMVKVIREMEERKY